MPYTSRGRAERLIAAGRVAFAVAAVTPWARAPEAAAAPVAMPTLLGVYAAGALLLAIASWLGPPPRSAIAGHAVDLLALAVLVAFGGPVRPLVLIALYLAAVAAARAYFGARERELRSEVSRLARWPERLPTDPSALFREVLGSAARILGAPRAVMIWDGPDAGRHLAEVADGTFEWSHQPADWLEPLVHGDLTGTSFLCRDVTRPAPTVVRAPTSTRQRLDGPPLHPELAARYGTRGVIAVRIAGDGWRGRLLFLDAPRMFAEDLILAEVVAQRVGASLDRFYLLTRLHDTAAAEERVRLARDLHDGVLQTLSGTVFQLEVLRRQLPEESHVRERLLEIQNTVVAQVHALRLLVRPLKAAEPAVSAPALTARLREVTQRIERQWGQRVELGAEGWRLAVPEPLAHEICHLVNEALVNAARHAGARTLRVEIAAADGEARLSVADDGHGFPFEGHWDLKALDAANLGPLSLRQRVRALQGDLSIESTPTGSRVEMALPLG